MNSRDLWQQRLQIYQKRVMKYARYMLNDHFMIVLFFLFGFFLFQYSNWIRTIRVLEWPLLLVLSGMLTFVPLIGQLATFTEEADVHFISVMQQDFQPYLSRALAYSWILPVVVASAAVGLVTPIFMQAYGSSVQYFIFLLANVLLGKYAHFLLQRGYFEGRLTEQWWHSLGVYVLTFLSLFCTMVGITNVMMILISGIELAILLAGKFWFEKTPLFYRWQLIVDTEQKRQQRFFRLIALFVDIPYLRKSPAKRRAYLDGVVNVLSPRLLHPYRYLLARTVMRSSNYLPLVVQTILLTGIVSLVSTAWYWTLIINSLVIILINFQLISLYQNTKEQRMYVQQLFSKSEMLDDFVGIILQLMMGIIVIVVIISVIATRNHFMLGGILVYPLVVVSFVQNYLKPRLKKVKKQVRN